MGSVVSDSQLSVSYLFNSNIILNMLTAIMGNIYNLAFHSINNTNKILL